MSNKNYLKYCTKAECLLDGSPIVARPISFSQLLLTDRHTGLLHM